jgi:hypothetical protein
MVQSEEREHLIDTFDPSLYEGEKDVEVDKPDYLDKYLVLSEETSDLVTKTSDVYAEEMTKGLGLEE